MQSDVNKGTVSIVEFGRGFTSNVGGWYIGWAGFGVLLIGDLAPGANVPF